MKKKGLFIAVILLLLAIIAVEVVVIINKGYRVIKVEDFDGAVTLERGSDEKEVFEGLKLKSEDVITTEEDGLMELLVDDDKHILAKENTRFAIQSTGNNKKGKLTIELKYGTSLVEIENKLPDGYDVEVETPNASLSVRGTTFEVGYDKAAKATKVLVTEGKVKVKVRGKKDSLEVEAGESVLVQEDEIIIIDVASQEPSKEEEPAKDEKPGKEEEQAKEEVSAGNESDTTADKPYYKQYLLNDDFPALIKGGSSYDQMRQMLKIALVADMNGHADYLKEALYIMCYEYYQTDVYEPVDGTENVYDIDKLNNMFSFLTDEKIEEKHLNEGSTISGNRLTTYREPFYQHELTAIGLASMYYGEDGGIVIEFLAEKHTIVDGASGPILQFKGVAYLVKDETDKYVFDHLEWEEIE